MLIDLRKEGMTGKEAARHLEEVGIIVNKNTIPFDTLPPGVTSGIRPGTPALTTRGLGPHEMEVIGDLIVRVVRSKGCVEEKKRVAKVVDEICDRFPIYQDVMY
jgi:glycine hydroxymethyltransferase